MNRNIWCLIRADHKNYGVKVCEKIKSNGNIVIVLQELFDIPVGYEKI